MEENMKLFDEIRHLKDKLDNQSFRTSRVVRDSFMDNNLISENKDLQYQLDDLRSQV